MVTHDLLSAAEVADRIGFLAGGCIVEEQVAAAGADRFDLTALHRRCAQPLAAEEWRTLARNRAGALAAALILALVVIADIVSTKRRGAIRQAPAGRSRRRSRWCCLTPQRWRPAAPCFGASARTAAKRTGVETDDLLAILRRRRPHVGTCRYRWTFLDRQRSRRTLCPPRGLMKAGNRRHSWRKATWPLNSPER